jgi:hypothetical protein
MEFCPRCGRYLKDDEYQCPECGNVARQAPHVEHQAPPGLENVEEVGPDGVIHFSLRKLFFDKWFFVAFAIAFAGGFLVTYLWRFSIILFCVPLFIPSRKISIGLGAFLGLAGGTAAALLIKYFLLSSIA